MYSDDFSFNSNKVLKAKNKQKQLGLISVIITINAK